MRLKNRILLDLYFKNFIKKIIRMQSEMKMVVRFAVLQLLLSVQRQNLGTTIQVELNHQETDMNVVLTTVIDV